LQDAGGDRAKGELTVSGLRKLNVKQLFCLCGFAFFGFFLWISLVPVTAAPVNPLVSQAIQVRRLRKHLLELRQREYAATGDYGQAVLAVEPDVQAIRRVIHQSSDGWAILSNDPELRRNAAQFQIGLAVMEDEAKILEHEVVVARTMQQVRPEKRAQLLKMELLPLIADEQVSRERLLEFRSRPGI
jgi:hypothetical protein